MLEEEGEEVCDPVVVVVVVEEEVQVGEWAWFIGLSVFCSRNQAKDHGLRTVQRTAYPT